MRCADSQTSEAMIAEIEKAHRDGDTLGGVVEVLAYNLPPGLGSHVHWDRRLDARLAAKTLVSIPPVPIEEPAPPAITSRDRSPAIP